MTMCSYESSHDDTSKYSNPSSKRRIPLHWLEARTITDQSSSSSRKSKGGTEILLPSFVDLQRKTLQTLYGTVDGSIIGTDKSPKGSVDAPIQPLVDLINKSSSYCTLSSCSGRLSLFDPNGRHEGIQGSGADAEDHDTNTGSGKGRGGWLLICHDPISPAMLVDCFPNANNTTSGTDDDNSMIPWVFKLEPMLLHIAARSLQKGKQLLQLALELGFRESGLVVSDARVTVAIRGHSLALSVPLAPNGPLRPSAAYLEALVQQANDRLEANWRQLDRLYDRVETTLFQVGTTPHIKATQIPSLNLWSAATVATFLPSLPEQDADNENNTGSPAIFAFGGYGTGPESNRHSARRSSEIYKLQCLPQDGDWSDWEAVKIQNPHDSDRLDKLAVSWVPKLPDYQGMGAVKFGSGGDLILLWGGRMGPKKPNCEIYLFDPSACSLATPLDIRGTPPSPRWGHSMVALDDRTIVMSGGCNLDEGAMNDVFILHFCDSYMCWEKIEQTLPTTLFHHMGVLLNDNAVCFFGGLQSTSNLLEPFQKRRRGSLLDELLWAIRIKMKQIDPSTGTVFSTVQVIQDTYLAAVSTPVGSSTTIINGLKKFGAAASSSDSVVLVSGGLSVSGSDDDDAPLEAYFMAADCDRISTSKIPLKYSNEETLDFGSLVHHAIIEIGTNEFLLIGGGATAFAFGQSFARSYHVRLEMPSTSPALDVSKMNGPKSSASNQGSNKKSSMAHVVTVAPKNAKTVKNKFQNLRWLDKRYRMIKQSPETIAIPVETSSLESIRQILENPSEPWHSLILGHGEEEMPFSTSQFAAKGKR